MKCARSDGRAGFIPVAPFTGAWIEIHNQAPLSLYHYVAPFTGAWIEMTVHYALSGADVVAPFTGAWIEIKISVECKTCWCSSHPSRVRGLK